MLPTLIFEKFPERHPVPYREDTVTRAAGKRELRVGAYAPPCLEPALIGAVRREDIHTKLSMIGSQR